MRVAIVARRSRDHGEIGFGFGIWSKRERQLCANVEAFAEHPSQLLLEEANGRRVPALLRCHFDELPIEQLDPILRARGRRS